MQRRIQTFFCWVQTQKTHTTCSYFPPCYLLNMQFILQSAAHVDQGQAQAGKLFSFLSSCSVQGRSPHLAWTD